MSSARFNPKLRITPGATRRDLSPPRPAELRRVWCPSCDTQFQASARAMSLTCPVCTKALTLRDVELACSIRGDVTAIGRVTVGRAMELSGRLVCVDFYSDGAFHGQARVGGAVELRPGSTTFGQVACRSLRAERGARVRVSASIGSISGLRVRQSA